MKSDFRCGASVSLRRRVIVALFLLCTGLPASAATVTLLHFSDYHSHALPSFSEGRSDQGGIARAIAYLERAHRNGALVFSGGDMMNRGSPAWSDKFHCVEWPWLNGIVDAMAYGNHDADYGADVFAACRAKIRYPVLSANVTDAGGNPVFPRYAVFERSGMRIGVFSVAGPDFTALVKPDTSPRADVRFTDAIAAARDVVGILRTKERADAIVLIGHAHTDDDFALARAVPGIDLIFGTHSHEKRELLQIPGTGTWFIAPFQYLTYISRVEMEFDGKRLRHVRGSLVPVNASIRPNRRIARRVAGLQKQLERDPEYAELFQNIAVLPHAVLMDDSRNKLSPFGSLVADVMRTVTNADFAIVTASTLRQSLPPGPLNLETLRAALPYDNEIVVAELSGERLQRVLDVSRERSGSDWFLQTSGATTIDPAATYRVAATDFLARVAPPYREVLAAEWTSTGLRMRNEVRRELERRFGR